MAVGRITRIPGGFLVVLPGRPGILQEYMGEYKELTEPNTELDQDTTGGVANVDIPRPEDVCFYTIENRLGLPKNEYWVLTL